VLVEPAAVFEAQGVAGVDVVVVLFAGPDGLLEAGGLARCPGVGVVGDELVSGSAAAAGDLAAAAGLDLLDGAFVGGEGASAVAGLDDAVAQGQDEAGGGAVAPPGADEAGGQPGAGGGEGRECAGCVVEQVEADGDVQVRGGLVA
jgi:hypothetical protein